MFQLLSAVEIAEALLRDWGITATWHVSRDAHPRLEYRVQHGETDHAFLSRTLEDAGITYFFETSGDETRLVFSDSPHAAELRGGGAVRFADNPNDAAEQEYATEVRLSHEARPTRVVVRGADFRRKPDIPLEAQRGDGGVRARSETYVFAPGWFLAAGERRGDTPVADDRGAFRADEKWASAHAERLLAASHAGAVQMAFRTNAADLAPGTVFKMAGHPRADLEGQALLLTRMSLRGGPSEEWVLRGEAAISTHPYRPPVRTEKPRVHGLETAVVVGPAAEEIHTDEHGRVRVQFLWDRYGHFDERSLCWVRVSQGWAGGGLGLVALPRVGQEVLVGFLGGDPDQPVVVGRLFNTSSASPYRLPESKTVSAWRTASSPASGGYNEIRLDDARGSELIHVRAERNLTKLVQLDELEETGVHRMIHVGQRLTLTTGRASIVLDGPDVSIVAEGRIDVRAAEDIDIRGEGGVWINEEDEEDETPPSLPPNVEAYSEMLLIKGPERFRRETTATLDRLSNTDAGERLLSGLDTAGEPVTIVPAASPRGATRPLDIAAANRTAGGAPSSGSGSTVTFHPDFRPGGAPPEVVLAFSLTQAHLGAHGLRETGLKGGRPLGKGKTGIRRAYRDALRAENEVRRELGLPRRTHY